jgi:hypothetical protein
VNLESTVRVRDIPNVVKRDFAHHSIAGQPALWTQGSRGDAEDRLSRHGLDGALLSHHYPRPILVHIQPALWKDPSVQSFPVFPARPDRP